jgi:hypothetical protein
MIRDKMIEIGLDVYKRDTKRWTYPSLVDNPYECLAQKMDYIRQRIAYLDTVYNYNQN